MVMLFKSVTQNHASQIPHLHGAKLSRLHSGSRLHRTFIVQYNRAHHIVADHSVIVTPLST